MAFCSTSFTELKPELLVDEQPHLQDYITRLAVNVAPAIV